MTNNLNTLLIQIGIPSTEYQTIEDRTTATSSIINESNETCKKRSIEFAWQASVRFGWQYKLVTEKKTKHNSPALEIFDIFINEAYDHYDRIIILDTDTYYFTDSPNILEYYPTEGFHAVSRMGKIFDVGKEPDHLARINKSHLVDKFKINYFNSGVILVDKSTREKLKPYFSYNQIEEWLDKKGLWSDDQSAFNIAIHEANVNIVPMHAYWNQMDKRYSEGYIVHLKGSIKNRENLFDKRAEGYLNAISSSN